MYGSQSFAESSFASEMESSVVKTQGASWSRAAPFEKDLYKYNISDKIGSHNTPTAANLSVGAGVGGRVRRGENRGGHVALERSAFVRARDVDDVGGSSKARDGFRRRQI